MKMILYHGFSGKEEKFKAPVHLDAETSKAYSLTGTKRIAKCEVTMHNRRINILKL
jgi:hypothetical protein